MQFILAVVVVAFGYRIESVEVAGWDSVPLGMAAVPLTVLWLAGFSNFFNFMDGIDGMSATSASVYFLFFFVFAWSVRAPEMATVALVFAAGCSGSLPHNFPVARTFMGDTGSLLLGMTIAVYVVQFAQISPAVLVPLLLVCSVYLWDTGFTLLRRLRHGENVFAAHRTHLYQRLVHLGPSHARITSLYLILHIIMGSLALAYFWSPNAMRGLIPGVAVLILVALTLAVYKVEARAAKSRCRQAEGAAGSST